MFLQANNISICNPKPTSLPTICEEERAGKGIPNNPFANTTKYLDHTPEEDEHRTASTISYCTITPISQHRDHESILLT